MRYKKCIILYSNLFNFLGVSIVFLLFNIQSLFGQTTKVNPWDSIIFPIFSWLGPSPDRITDSTFIDMIDAGFTLNMSNKLDYKNNVVTRPTTAENLKMLDVAEKIGLKLIIIDSRIDPTKPIDSNTYLQLDTVIKTYKPHKAFLGYLLHDEPNASLFDNIAKIKTYLIEKDPDHLVYTNLFPSYVYPSAIGAPNYNEYLTGYINKIQPQILSFDNYYFKGQYSSSYFENLELIRKTAISNNIPFWAFVLSTPHGPYEMPTQGHISYQLYCDLAYGAKGLQYFTYGFIPNLSLLAPIDSAGLKTPIWIMAKQINTEILKLAPTLKSLKSIDVYHSFPLPQGTHPLPNNFLIKAIDTIPMLIGYFENGKSLPYILFVNRNFDEKGNSRITFHDSVYSIIEISKIDGLETDPIVLENTHILSLDFNPGEGRLYRIQKKKFLNIDPDTIYLDALENNPFIFEIKSNTNWTITSDSEWIIAQPTSGSNNARIIITTTTNNTIKRTANIRIKSEETNPKTLVIIQLPNLNSSEKKIDSVKIYPLITRDKVYFNIPKLPKESILRIYDSKGMLVYSTKIIQTNFELNISLKKNEVYFIHILSKDYIIKRKVIKI